MKRFLRITLVLAIIAAAGLCAIPFYKVWKLEQTLDQAARNARGGRPRDALLALRTVERWSYDFPAVAHRMNLELIRAHAYAGNLDAALDRCEWVRVTDSMLSGREKFTTHRPSAMDTISRIPNAICYAIAARDTSIPKPFDWDSWSGYAVLRESLAGSGAGDLMADFRTHVRAIDSASPLLSTRVVSTAPASRKAPVARRDGAMRPKTKMEKPRRERQGSTPAEIDKHIQALVAYDKQQDNDRNDLALKAKRARAATKAVPAWGVVRATPAKVFNLAAVRQRRSVQEGEARVGTTVSISDFLTPGFMTLAVCTLEPGAQPVVIRLADLNVQAGSLLSSDPAERRLRQDRVQIAARLAGLRSKALKSVQSGHPAVAEFRRAAAAHRKFHSEVKRLQESLETSGDHAAAFDRLRKMKYDEAAINAAYKNAWAAYAKWKTQQEPSPVDHQIARAKDELTRIDGALTKIAN